MLNYSVLPHTTITGRITNNSLQLQHSKKRHTPYLIMMLYLQDGHTAHLAPVIAFNYRAKQLYQDAKQGDLLSVQATIEFHYYKGYFNPSLVVSNWSFREAPDLRKVVHQQPLHKLFPFIPNNYPYYLRHKLQTQQSSEVAKPKTNHKAISKSSTHASTIEVKPHIEQNKTNEKETSTADWLSQLDSMTKFAFPTMN